VKTDKFSIKRKDEIFTEAHPMHDCSFTASFENNTLVLVFDHLDKYYDAPPVTTWFGDYKKLTVKYRNTEFLNLSLKYGKKEKDFYDTVVPLSGKELIMFKFSIDSFNYMQLDFRAIIKKKLWRGIIEIAPDEIEYIWE